MGLGAFFCLLALTLCSTLELELNCTEEEFPCDDGKQCVLKNKWCDTTEDCNDDSDEDYCHMRSYFNADPNKCTGEKFICKNGMCIPFSGRCDGVISCPDNSDEQGCEKSTEENAVKSTIFLERTSTIAPKTSSLTSRATFTSSSSSKLTTAVINKSTEASANSTPASVPVNPLQDHPRAKSGASKYLITEEQERARLKAELFLLRHDNFSAKDIARAAVALYLSNKTCFSRGSKESQYISRNLERQLSIDLIRNETHPITLEDLALYLNALLAICLNPHNFHGVELSSILRMKTDMAIMAGEFVSPSVYLSLCILRKGSFDDIEKLREIFTTQDKKLLRLDIQALAMIAASCYSKVPEFSSLNTKLYGAPKLILDRITGGTYTDVYTTALLNQALAAAGLTDEDWKRSEAMSFLLNSQSADGSFGDVLATYYVMPLLSGNRITSLEYPCYKEKNGVDLNELYSKQRKIVAHISLVVGSSAESVQTMQLKVPDTAKFLDVVRMAGNQNPKFRLNYDQLTSVPTVYKIGDISNDAERRMFWDLYVEEKVYPVIEEATLSTLNLFTEDFRKLTLKNGSHVILWFKKV